MIFILASIEEAEKPRYNGFMNYSDCHCHMDLLDLDPAGPILLNSKGMDDWNSLSLLSKRGSRCFIGLHPWEPASQENTSGALHQLETLLRNNSSLGVGEIGLDGGARGRDEAVQRHLFREQCRLALQYRRPLSLHLHKCWNWFWEDIAGMERSIPMLVHGFTGSPELARQLVQKGFLLSLSPRSFRKGQDWLKKIFAVAGRDALLIESDYDGSNPLTKDGYLGLMREQYRILANISGCEIEDWRMSIGGHTSLFTN